MNNKWGLGSRGFYRPNQKEIRDDLDIKTRELFGANVNLNNKSPNGIINGVLSWFYAMLWEMAEKVYKSAYPSQAEGVSLDYLTIFFGTTRRRMQYAEGRLKFTGTAGHVIPFGRLYEKEDKVQYVLIQEVQLDSSGVGYGNAVAYDAGAKGNTLADTITIQVEPDSDITAVTNVDPFEGGADEESDVELRKRLAVSASALGSGTIDAIYADLLEVSGVRAVRIKVNEESTTVDGLPPHSIAVYTYGGDENSIARALIRNYTGIQFFGSTVVSVPDVSGFNHDIGFSKATITPVQFEIAVDTNNTFPSDGPTAVKDAIINVVGGTLSNGSVSNGLNMGDDVLYARMIAAVMSVQGVTNVKLEMNKKGTLPLTTDDIVIDDMQVANVEAIDIAVTVNA